jgi:DNA-binding NarL/FixJ family response regulator
MRIVLASHNSSFRRALKILLQGRHGYDIVGEAKNGRELISEIERRDPELVLLDEDIIDQPFAELIATLHSLDASLDVIVFSENRTKTEMAMNAGASSFVLKGGPPNMLFIAIENIRLKDTYEERTHYHGVL